MNRRVLLLAAFILLAMSQLVAAAPPAQASDGEAYVVQEGDWLSKIAQRVYGDGDAYGAIVAATNAKAAEDPSFAVIDNPALIRVGQKLWIPAQPDGAEGRLSLAALRNAIYRGIYDEPVQLADGQYEGEPFVPGGASRPKVTLQTDVYAWGDLNGDGMEDAAVILIESSGGSGSFRYLAAVLNEAGAASNVATQLLGDRENVQAVRIEGNEIAVTLLAHGPDDPMCCPSQVIAKRYQLQEDQLVEVSPPFPALAGLEGREWVLRSFGDVSYPQAVAEGSQITALFDPVESTVTGSAGCNRYFAAYTVDGTAITMGPPGSTLMACAEPAVIMVQEDAYLTALESMASYDVKADSLRMTSCDGSLALDFVASAARIVPGQAYVVRTGDSLARIAQLAYGDADAYPLIVEATDARAAEDASFAVIDDPALIRVGQKLWIPERPASGEGS